MKLIYFFYVIFEIFIYMNTIKVIYYEMLIKQNKILFRFFRNTEIGRQI